MVVLPDLVAVQPRQVFVCAWNPKNHATLASGFVRNSVVRDVLFTPDK